MIEVVCGVVFDRGGRVLACRRGAAKHLAGKWEFPGGKVDLGESSEHALKRELMEELRIEVEILGLLENVVEWSDGNVSIRLTGFRCEIVGGELSAVEHAEVRWCDVLELITLDWAEADIPLVRELMGGR